MNSVKMYILLYDIKDADGKVVRVEAVPEVVGTDYRTLKHAASAHFGKSWRELMRDGFWIAEGTLTYPEARR